MENFKPSYVLEKFQQSSFTITRTALKSAAELGLDSEGIRNIVATMEPSMFYKSMTSYADHRVWQDVYHVPWENCLLYIKFTEDMISEFLLLSFKEK